MDYSKFTNIDWDNLHDVVFDATGKSLTRSELEKIFDKLSTYTQNLADVWGMNDTPFKDRAFDEIKALNNLL
jgi:hypothetical protein